MSTTGAGRSSWLVRGLLSISYIVCTQPSQALSLRTTSTPSDPPSLSLQSSWMTSSRKYLKANTRVLGRLASLRSTPTCRSTRIQGTLTTSCVCRPNWTRRRLSWYVDVRLISRNRDSERIFSTRPWSPYFNAGRSWMILSIGLKLSPCRVRCSTRPPRRCVSPIYGCLPWLT